MEPVEDALVMRKDLDVSQGDTPGPDFSPLN